MGPTTLVWDARSRTVVRELQLLWEYRELLFFLAWRDVKLKYKQTVLGLAWVALQPLLTVVTFSIFLGRLVGVPSDGLPYPLFALVALVPWQLFANAFAYAANSLIMNRSIITKVFFPRLVIPLASILANLVDFVIMLVLLVVVIAVAGLNFTLALGLLPLFFLLAVFAAAGLALWLSALNVRYRDVHHVLPFLTQFLLFASPIAYPSSLVPPTYRAWMGLNPVAGVIEGFRWSLLGDHFHSLRLIGLSTLTTIVLVVTGLMVFSRFEKSMADVI